MFNWLTLEFYIKWLLKVNLMLFIVYFFYKICMKVQLIATFVAQ